MVAKGNFIVLFLVTMICLMSSVTVGYAANNLRFFSFGGVDATNNTCLLSESGGAFKETRKYKGKYTKEAVIGAEYSVIIPTKQFYEEYEFCAVNYVQVLGTGTCFFSMSGEDAFQFYQRGNADCGFICKDREKEGRVIKKK